MPDTKQSQPPPGWMGKSARRIRYDWMMSGFFQRPIFWPGRSTAFQEFGKNDALLHKIVYHHDSAAKQTGYPVTDRPNIGVATDCFCFTGKGANSGRTVADSLPASSKRSKAY
jgi:hypothetical protein